MYHSVVALLPFDPGQALGAEDARDGSGHLTVSEVAELIRSTLENHVPSPLRVIGQVSNLSNRKHWYFSLKDEESVLGCVAWVSAARTFGFVPEALRWLLLTPMRFRPNWTRELR